MDNAIMHGDCLELMKDIPDGSIDMVLCDLPYGVTNNKWDSIIPFEPLWEQYERVIKTNGAIALFAQSIFAYKLGLSNEKLFRYDLIWHKQGKATGFLNANRMPLRNHEHILIFYKQLPVYNPQKTKGDKNYSKGSHSRGKKQTNNNYGKFDQSFESEPTTDKFPLSIVSFPSVHPPIHPTQKSDLLCEWLIKTYTNENEIVLDNCAGSFTTAIACLNTNRHYICMEKEKKYFDIGEKRIADWHKEKSSELNLTFNK